MKCEECEKTDDITMARVCGKCNKSICISCYENFVKRSEGFSTFCGCYVYDEVLLEKNLPLIFDQEDQKTVQTLVDLKQDCIEIYKKINGIDRRIRSKHVNDYLSRPRSDFFKVIEKDGRSRVGCTQCGYIVLETKFGRNTCHCRIPKYCASGIAEIQELFLNYYDNAVQIETLISRLKINDVPCRTCSTIAKNVSDLFECCGVRQCGKCIHVCKKGDSVYEFCRHNCRQVNKVCFKCSGILQEGKEDYIKCKCGDYYRYSTCTDITDFIYFHNQYKVSSEEISNYLAILDTIDTIRSKALFIFAKFCVQFQF